MPISRRRIEVAVGAMMLMGITCLLLSVVFIGQRRGIFDRRVRLQTQFQSVEGLQPGARVHLAGIPAGSVEAVVLSPEGDVRVHIELRASVAHRIREDSTARIKTAGLVGDRYIDITVGSSDSPRVKPGGTITGIQPLDVTQVLADAGPMFRDLATGIENVRLMTARLLDEESNTNQTLRNLADISASLAEGRGTFGRLLKEDDVYEDLRATLASARRTVANTEAITEELRKQGPEVLAETREAVGNVSRASERAEAIMVQSFDDIPKILAGVERSVADLEAMMQNLRQASEDIKAATPRLPDIVAEGQTAVDDARDVLAAARAHPLLRRYFDEQELDAPILVRDRAGINAVP